MNINFFIIKSPKSWELIDKSLISCSKDRTINVEYIKDINDISSNRDVISVFVRSLSGLADYAIEVYGKNVLNLPDDTIGMHLAKSLGSNVIISDGKANPYSWTLLQPDGQIIGISVDIDKLDNNSIFEYKKIG